MPFWTMPGAAAAVVMHCTQRAENHAAYLDAPRHFDTLEGRVLVGRRAWVIRSRLSVPDDGGWSGRGGRPYAPVRGGVDYREKKGASVTGVRRIRDKRLYDMRFGNLRSD